MKNKLKQGLIIGGLAIGGGAFYSGTNPINYPNLIENNSKSILLFEEPLKSYFETIATNYITEAKNSTSFENAKKQYERYKDMEEKTKENDLEKIVEAERRILDKEEFSRPFYLTEDSLTACIKQAYKNVKKWPKEIDKRLLRVLIKQESSYNIHAISSTGYMGLGQIGAITYENFKPDKFATFKDSNTGKLDTIALQRELFNPVTNLEIALENLDYISKFCKKYNPNWNKLSLEDKRKEILACYSAGCTKIKDEAKWNLKSKKLKKENIEYPELIMNKYHNPKVKVKI